MASPTFAPCTDIALSSLKHGLLTQWKCPCRAGSLSQLLIALRVAQLTLPPLSVLLKGLALSKYNHLQSLQRKPSERATARLRMSKKVEMYDHLQTCTLLQLRHTMPWLYLLTSKQQRNIVHVCTHAKNAHKCIHKPTQCKHTHT